jgi:G:T-mismatch repair DNA endonuclease (very short patch repair protein)
MQGKPVTLEDISRIKNLRLLGLSIYEIGKQVNRAPSFVYGRIRSLGLQSCLDRTGNGKKAWKSRRQKFGRSGCSPESLQKRIRQCREQFSGEHNPSRRADVRQKISLAQKGVPCPQRDPNPEKRIKASMKALHIRPNKPERKLGNLLQQLLPNEYKFVGDGSFMIERKCPDFVNVNGKKKIIELFGRVFHNPKKAFFEIPYERTEQGRIELFKKYGFDTLIVWDFELDNVSMLSEKLMEFHNGEQS